MAVPTIVVGIDPGQKGAMACLIDGTAGEAIRMPGDPREAAEWLYGIPVTHVFLEKAQSFPGQGVSSAFNYGAHYGELKGLLIALKIPFSCVSPRNWTCKMHMGLEKDDPKALSLEACRRLYPHLSLVPQGCKKPHDGIVDAYLIATFGYRFVLQGGLRA